jgi:hypothetical protein
MRGRNKYGNVPVEADGYTFDSRAEARRYEQLKLLVYAGEISQLEIHPKYEIVPAFRRDGKLYPARFYEADFAYMDAERRAYTEDVKGVVTDVFSLKRQLFLLKYPERNFVLTKASEV